MHLMNVSLPEVTELWDEVSPLFKGETKGGMWSNMYPNYDERMKHISMSVVGFLVERPPAFDLRRPSQY